MIIFSLIFLMLCFPAYADVFKTSQPAENALLKEAFKKDKHGLQYDLASLRLDTDLTRHQYTYGKGGVESIPKGYMTFDLDQSIKRELSRDQFTGPEIIQLTSRYQGLSQNQLMLLQYSSPAAADLFKHFHSTAMLKMIIQSQQYSHLKEEVNDPIYDLIARSTVLCVNKRLQQNNTSSLHDAIEYCQGRDVLESLAENEKEVLKYSLNLISTPRNIRDEILELTGDVQLKDDDYNFDGPVKRMGRLLKEETDGFFSKLQEIIEKFKTQQIISEEDLEELSLPGLEIYSFEIRNLAMLEPHAQRVALFSIAAELAHLKVIARHQRADEYLRRALENPNVDASLKEIISERRLFLKEELNALSSEVESLKQYNQKMRSIMQRSDKERLQILKDIQEVGNE